jgi:hypothetical protein
MSREEDNQNRSEEKNININKPKLPDLGRIEELRNNDHFNKGESNKDGYIGKPKITQINPPTKDEE